MATEITLRSARMDLLEAEQRYAEAVVAVKKARQGLWLALYLNVFAVATSVILYWRVGKLNWGMALTPLNIVCVVLLIWKIWKTR